MRFLPPLIILFAVLSPAGAGERALDVTRFGAVGDGKTLATAAIQKAIDACASEGGGTVRIPKGTFLSGAIRMRSGVRLHLDEGAVLSGSRNREDYYGPPLDEDGNPVAGARKFYHLIHGYNLHDIAITGPGTINGNGDAFRDKSKARTKAIHFERCRGILIEGVRLRNAGSWMQHYRLCRDLTIRNIDVFNHIAFNNDGLDVDSCSNVTITGCRIDSDDDAIVLKSLSTTPCENITIRDCTVSSHCNALKMGTESGGGFVNITIENCTVFSPKHSQKTYGKQRGLAGVALEIVDGGRMDNIRVSDIDIEGVSVPIFLRLGNRARAYGGKKPGVGTMRNIRIRRVKARGVSPIGCAIAGIPGHAIEDVRLEEIELSFEGGGSKEDGAIVPPEKIGNYPECTMFGKLPAYGFFCRHLKGVHFKNITLTFEKPDRRHAMVFDDVRELTIDGLTTEAAPDGCAIIRLTNTQDSVLQGVEATGADGKLVEVSGETSGVRLLEVDRDQP